MARLNIAHVSNGLGGGVGTVCRVLLPAQVQRGDHVSFFVRIADSRDLSYFRANGIDMHRITSVPRLAKELRKYDIVHLHRGNLDLLAAGWLSQRATVFTLHGLHAQTRALGTVLREGHLPTLGGIRRRAKRLGLSLALCHAITSVIAVSQFVADRATVLYGIDPSRVTVVHNGIALDRFRGRAGGGDSDGMVVGWLGRLARVKRVDVLLRAVASIVARGLVPGLRVVLVGEGPLRGELEALAVSLGIKPLIDFAGHTDTPERYLAQMSVLALPSIEEGAPMAINEAMASGVPVVVLQDGGGAVELVQRSGAGIVVPDEVALAAEIVGLLENAELRRELGEHGVAYAVRELAPLAWAERYDKVYGAALARRRRAAAR